MLVRAHCSFTAGCEPGYTFATFTRRVWRVTVRTSWTTWGFAVMHETSPVAHLVSLVCCASCIGGQYILSSFIKVLRTFVSVWKINWNLVSCGVPYLLSNASVTVIGAERSPGQFMLKCRPVSMIVISW